MRPVKKTSKFAAIWEAPAGPTFGESELELLGAGIKQLPTKYWQPGMLFKGARDHLVRTLTGVFPAKLGAGNASHPLYVLQILSGLGHRVCPCSSKDWGERRFIRSGCVLQYTHRVTDRDSYLVESCPFNLPADPEFRKRLGFLGMVPAECLESRP